MKFLLILVIFSVLPLLVFFFINQKMYGDLGEEVYQIATVLLLQTASKEIEESASNYAQNFKREFYSIGTLAKMCRDDINAALASSAGNSGNRDVDTPLSPAVSEALSLCKRRLQDFLYDFGEVRVNFNKGRVGESKETATSRRQAVPDYESRLFERQDPLWPFPARHPFPAGREGLTSLSLPLLPTTRLGPAILLIEFDYIGILEAIRPKSQWSSLMHTLLVQSPSGDEREASKAAVIAVRKASPEANGWTADSNELTMAPQSIAAIETLSRGIQLGEAGFTSLPYGNEPSLWAYAEIDKGLAIVNILPEREVLYRIARHPARLNRWVNLDSFLAVSTLVLAMIIIATLRSKRMLSPFFALVTAFREISSGDFSTRLSFSAKDERQMVATAFNSMASQLQSTIRLRQSLEVAEEVQQNFFPDVAPTHSTLDIDVMIRYCEETGGDYVDFINREEGITAVVVADVTGHGIGAALLMATVRALIRGCYDPGCDLAALVSSINRSLTHDMKDSGRFVSLFILEVDQNARCLRWVRAGHDPAWLFSKETGAISMLGGQGVVLGVESEISYAENYRDTYDDGDIIVIGTDGIWETSNSEGRMFGKERLANVVGENMTRTAAEINRAILLAVNRFRREKKQEDDISCAVVKFPS